VDDLASRNKMLAIVRVSGSIVSRSIVKVRQTEQGEPVLHIERPLFRRGYGFVKEIAQALAKAKAPAMNVKTITGYQYKSDSTEDSIQVFSTGARAPTEYHESLFSWRLRDQKVYHRATRILQTAPSASSTKLPLMTPALRRLLLRNGQPLPSLWEQSWLAGKAEYKWSLSRSRFVARHHPKTLGHRVRLNLGWGAIWAGTAILPSAAIVVSAMLGVAIPVAVGVAVVVWAVTQRFANITTHAAIDLTVGLIKQLFQPIQTRLDSRNERQQLKTRLSVPSVDASEDPALNVPSSETRRLLAESSDGPSASALREAYERIRISA